MTLTPNQTTEPEIAAELPLAEETIEPTHDDDQGHDDHSGHGHTHHHEHPEEPHPTLNPALMREISVEVDADTVSKSFRKVIKKYQRLARIPGFRVGKVPETVIKGRFGREVRQEVLEELVSERFRMAIEEQKLSPVSQPQLTAMTVEDGLPLKFGATFEIKPEIDVTGYESVPVAKLDTSVTDAEFAAELTRAMEQHGTVEPVEEDRALVDGDWAEIEFKGEIQELAQVVGEEPAEKPAAEPISGDDVLIEVGGANTVDAFNGALRGAKPGQEMTFEVTYPEDFGERRLAGQTVKYDMKLKAIKKKTYPEKDDEFAAELGYLSWAEFEEKLRERLGGRKKDALEGQAKDKMVGDFLERFQFPVPETFVQAQIDARLDRGLRALAQQGMKPEDMRKLDFGRLRAAQRDQAVNEVKASMILDRIAQVEGIKLTDDELNRELLLASMQAREPLETLRARMIEDGSLDRMREQMLREKTGTIVFEKLAK